MKTTTTTNKKTKRNPNDTASWPSAEKAAHSKKDTLNQKRYVVETITMTTVTERRIVHEETNTTNSIIESTAGSGANATAMMASNASIDKTHDTSASIIDTNTSSSMIDTTSTNNNSSSSSHSTYLTNSNAKDISLKPNSISAQITGILKGGKLWKSEQSQVSGFFSFFFFNWKKSIKISWQRHSTD